MADNTTLNPGAAGDVIRDLARQGGTTKTQVVALDLGGPAANPENLIAAGQNIMLNSLPVVTASDQPSDSALLKVADLLTQLLTPTAIGVSSPFEQLASNIRSILQEMSPWNVNVKAANGPVSPYPLGAKQLTASTEITVNTTGTATLTPSLGQTAYITGFVASGTGATAALNASITIFNLIGGQLDFPYAVPAGVGIVAPIMNLTFNPPLMATGPNIAIQINQWAFGSGSVGQQLTAWGYCV